MEKMLQELKGLFENSTFHYSDDGDARMKKTYFCTAVKLVAGNFKIICKSRTFVKKDYEVNPFVKRCIFENSVAALPKNEENNSLVLSEESNIQKASKSLFTMFEKVSNGQASKEDIEKAKLMVSLSGRLVDIEKVKLGYFNLK